MTYNLNEDLAKLIVIDFGMVSNIIICTLLAASAAIDIKECRIPDWLIIAGVSAGLFIIMLDPQRTILEGLLGAISAGTMLLIIFFITRGGIGLGDVKLFSCMGIYLKFEGVVSVLFISALLCGLFALALVCLIHENKKRQIPFAPFIFAGVIAEILL